eukprot:TRINITY_DN109801_c0_g1_i1.p1 TRINITY_DN109801_c0_g1~~TRINITY_DN109801_c0_g1_i1.p1  ORF type:complete len:203 (-),score=17.35 TRINITY_DN109801_c0_g1_i1:236-844(-)
MKNLRYKQKCSGLHWRHFQLLVRCAVIVVPLVAFTFGSPFVSPKLSGGQGHWVSRHPRCLASTHLPHGQSSVGLQADAGRVIEASESDIDAAVRDGRQVVLDVYAQWCGPCKMIEPLLNLLARKLDDHSRTGVEGESFKPLVMRMDSDKYPSKSSGLGVDGLPTIIFFDEGEEVERFEGMVRLDELEEMTASAFVLDNSFLE